MYELYNNYLENEDKNEWKVAIYVRLSREDEKDEKYKGQSESIETQIKYLTAFVKENKWTIVDIYKDDGYTGTNFDRPDFQRMIKDIEKGEINLVITKDLSRLGRDYIDTGRYVQKYFPANNVRYIAVNDNIDTFDKRNNNNDITPFKSVINDMYAKDISDKVRSAIYTKAQGGECIKAFLPYGYKKDVKDKNNILIDEEVADNVRLIFNLYKEGNGKKQICDYLNGKGIKTPLQYKKENTNYFNPNKKDTYRWSSTVISKILRDRIYVGDLIQLKYTKVNYKVKKSVKVPEQEQIVIENHHPAIIDRNTYNTVQEMLDKKSNEWNYMESSRHLLTGLVFCGCGSKITYNKNHGKYSRCVCSSYKKFGKGFCTNIHLKEEELLVQVAKSLKNNIDKYLNMKNLKYDNIKKNQNINQNINQKKDVQYIKQKKEKIDRIIGSLYEDKAIGTISIDTFSKLIKQYEKQKEDCEKKMQTYLQEERKVIAEAEINKKQITETMKRILTFDEINEENKSLVFKLIDKIIVNDKDIQIEYKFDISA